LYDVQRRFVQVVDSILHSKFAHMQWRVRYGSTEDDDSSYFQRSIDQSSMFAFEQLDDPIYPLAC
jgi:hypothetical protein